MATHDSIYWHKAGKSVWDHKIPMKALVIAARYGPRLEPLTLAVPKPMAPIANLPTMRHNLELLKKHGFTDITANIHYHPEQIENYFGDGSAFGVDLAYSFEKELQGTAGGVKLMAKLARVEDTFLVLSSDALTDIDLSALVAFHREKKALVTIALCQVEEVSDFGVVVHDENGKVIAFQEKPKPAVALSDLVNIGIYVIEPEILKLIPDGFYDFGRQLFPKLAQAGAAIFGCRLPGYWSDVGNLQKYMQANSDALLGNVKIGLEGEKTIENSLVGRHCSLGKNVILKNSIIGDNCNIGDGSVISGSIIWSDTVVGEGANVENAIIGSWCRLGKNARIGVNSVLANRCVVSEGKTVAPGAKLAPNTTL